MNIKTFKDGNRFVIVFEGLDDMPSQENMIKAFLGGICPNVTEEKAAEVQPVCVEDNMPQNVMFIAGPYAGQTPQEILEAEGKRGFIYLVSQIRNQELPGDLLLAIDNAVTGYLRQFANCDADAYSKKLSDKQLSTFIQLYWGALPDSVIAEKIKVDPTQHAEDIARYPDGALRQIVKDMILYFKAL